ncbi:MAG: DsbA family oxidoreductase [Erysipelothrix sp.]|nr:DsbA family oxidoreductase [Erysipelothrix sp.]
MKVQVFSDFVCPFCYIGKTHLEQAIKEVDPTIEIEMMSFELDPYQEDIEDVSIAQHLANKYGMSVDDAIMNNNRIKEMAKSVGLDFNFDTMKLCNTFNAHKIFQYAKTKGLANEVSNKFLEAYFSLGQNINDKDTLIRLSKEGGLSEEQVLEALKSDELAYKVKQEQQHAASIGVKGVPHFVIDDQVFLSGAQPVQTFKDALLHVKTLNFNKVQDGLTCDDGLCDI